MRLTVLSLAAFAGAIVASTARADVAVGLEISNDTGAALRIEGDGTQAGLTFTPGTSGSDFFIRAVRGFASTGDSLNLFGSISGGFHYLASEISGPPNFQEATLYSDNAQLEIGNADVGYLRADIGDSVIRNVYATGLVNTELIVNLSNIQYDRSGATDPAIQDFVAFADATKGTSQFSWSLGSGVNLASMTASNYSNDFGNFSGDLTVVPEPGPLVLTALTAVPALGLYLRRRRRAA